MHRACLLSLLCPIYIKKRRNCDIAWVSCWNTHQEKSILYHRIFCRTAFLISPTCPNHYHLCTLHPLISYNLYAPYCPAFAIVVFVSLFCRLFASSINNSALASTAGCHHPLGTAWYSVDSIKSLQLTSITQSHACRTITRLKAFKDVLQLIDDGIKKTLSVVVCYLGTRVLSFDVFPRLSTAVGSAWYFIA